ncbi:hypothetical protein SEA_STEPHIG9_40 [Mycobacterium phage Stephig9]|uniref:Uncharacterized protein n=1 Tax=Mycobacterium phage Stephig9 TaxID=2591224 RepID=A0A514DHA0_9CAUD|nr:hypothetical protein SEA_STEPHIG9_40 [Mycobacterium phage Stephig9]
MKEYLVEVHIPAQDLEVEVLALDKESARRIALRDVTPLEVSAGYVYEAL